MKIVIKNTKTVEEFKNLHAKIEKLAVEYSQKHMAVCEKWENGGPVKAWQDADNNICIEYSNGQWWHYRMNNNQLEWW